MELYQNLGNFLDNYGSPFFVGSLVEKKVLFVNKEAKTMFDCTEETCNFEKIFERTEERLETLIEKGLNSGGNTIFYNFLVNTGTQDKIVVDFQFGFFNDEKTEMFLEILPQQDTRLQMAKNQIRHSPRAEAILNFDENLSIVDCNEAFYKVFECNEELCRSHCKHELVNGFFPETRESFKAKIHDTLKTSEIFSTETKVFTPNGEEKWYRLDLQKRVLDSTGTKLMCYMFNIEKQVELKAENSLLIQQMSAMQELTNDILFRIDISDNTFYHSNEETTNIGIMLKTENYVETFIANGNIHPDDVAHYRKCNEKLKTGELNQYEIRAEVEKGVYHAFDVKCTLIFSNTGEPTEIFGRMKDIQERKDLEARASHDLMTQVLNKVSFEDSVAMVLANSIQGLSHAIIFIDLDDFKGINDNFGHDFGDFLLTTVGKRLKRVVRETDLIGRLGGDEFAVMLKSIGTPEAATLRVKLLLDTLQRPFSFEGKTVEIKASIGFAIAPVHGNDYKILIKKADIALYSSKRIGKNVATLYSEELEEY